eukprot:TRINITY_DN7597_c1_g1_i2.p1 TRINITY_DN7597_c1_g1~~TRINITY_DN7597_c1_g1_i2.p1  ORF type:complete len:983 (-),score=104.63 TRINITY_DN7597_c1_g1_i2:86-3034(-)
MGGNMLSSLPESFSKLTKLELLSLSANRFTNIPSFIGELPWLTNLDLSDNQLEEYPDLHRASTLVKLNTDGNNFHPVIQKALSSLDTVNGMINLKGKGLDYFPDVYIRLPWIFRNRIHTIDLSENHLTSLPEWIVVFTQLKHLNIELNKIIRLPPTLYLCKALARIDVEGNPLCTQDELLLSQGVPHALSQYESICREITHWTEFRTLVIGEAGSGKRALIKALGQDHLNFRSTCKDRSMPFVGIQPRKRKIKFSYNPKKLEGSLWHCGGYSEFKMLHPCLVTDKSIILFVWDMTLGSKRVNFQRWLDSIASVCHNSHVIIVGTHSDHYFTTDRALLDNIMSDVEQYAANYNSKIQFHGFIPVSCLTGENIPLLKDYILKTASQLPQFQKDVQVLSMGLIQAIRSIAQFESTTRVSRQLLADISQDFSSKIDFEYVLELLHDVGDIIIPPHADVQDHIILNGTMFYKTISSILSTTIKHQGNIGFSKISSLEQVLREIKPHFGSQLLNALDYAGIIVPSRDQLVYIFPSLLPPGLPVDCVSMSSENPGSSGCTVCLEFNLVSDYMMARISTHFYRNLASSCGILSTNDYWSAECLQTTCYLAGAQVEIEPACTLKLLHSKDQSAVYATAKTHSGHCSSFEYIQEFMEDITAMFDDFFSSKFVACHIVCPKCMLLGISPAECGRVQFQDVQNATNDTILACGKGHNYEGSFWKEGIHFDPPEARDALKTKYLPALYQVCQESKSSELNDYRLHILCDNPFEPHVTTHQGFPLRTKSLIECDNVQAIFTLLGAGRAIIQEGVTNPLKTGKLLNEWYYQHPNDVVRFMEPEATKKLLKNLDPEESWRSTVSLKSIPNGQIRLLCEPCSLLFNRHAPVPFGLSRIAVQAYVRNELEPGNWCSRFLVMDTDAQCIHFYQDNTCGDVLATLELKSGFHISVWPISEYADCLRYGAVGGASCLILFPTKHIQDVWFHHLFRCQDLPERK